MEEGVPEAEAVPMGLLSVVIEPYALAQFLDVAATALPGQTAFRSLDRRPGREASLGCM
jgi:hypothetical protein